ncbi:MAG: hypothetical protein GXP46_03825 [Deferribacteres bacterium]|nr:hypothetical protein [Deferribacteres bacterium]
MKDGIITIKFVVSILTCLIILGCASAPKNARNYQEQQLVAANNEHYDKGKGYVVQRGFKEAKKVNLNALMQEIQKTSEKPDEVTIIWWLPEEFWRVNFAQRATMTEAQIERVLGVLRHYMIIMVIDGKIGPLGGVTYKSEETIRNSIQLIDSQGVHYRPLSSDEIDADTKNFLSMFRPVLSNILGPMGQNMQFFIFPSKNKNRQDIADAKREGAFSVKLGKKEFKWRLPLGSLLPEKTCPVDGEKLNGAWKFCPWHGVELK